MLKRFMVLAVAVTGLAIAAPSNGACIGLYQGTEIDDAELLIPESVTYDDEGLVASYETDDTITADVSLVATIAEACDDTGVTTTGDPVTYPTTLTITPSVGNPCSAETTSDWDPFGFGTGIHDVVDGGDNACNADISWGGFTSVFLPDAERSGGDASGGQLVVSKTATVDSDSGTLRLAYVGGRAFVANGTGVIWKGVGGSA